MARKTRREKQMEEVSKEAEMDMTPMIDVVFLLIIFFLCIDFRVLEAKLPAPVVIHHDGAGCVCIPSVVNSAHVSPLP